MSDQIVQIRGEPCVVSGATITLPESLCLKLGWDQPDGSCDARLLDAVRRSWRESAGALADKLGKSVEVFGSLPDAQDWVVDVVEPTNS